MEYLMPDYFPDFLCKMGACRHACCEGWPVWFSLDDYFRLEGIDCSKELRDRMDRGIRISLEPTPERYAQFVPRYDGNCYMRLDDGRCALQAEFGEKALTDVCRLYPRGARQTEDGAEISCANSCERTLELLLCHETPIEFIVTDSNVTMPPQAERRFFFDTMGMARKLRLAFIKIIQRRELSLPSRLRVLGTVMQKAETAIKKHDAECLNAVINGQDVSILEKELCSKDIIFGFVAAEKLIAMLDEQSDSIKSFGAEALAYYGSRENAYGNYISAKKSFEESFPLHEIFFENMLVNYMFFSEFPLADRPESFEDEYASLCTVYTLLRFLCIGYCVNHKTEAELIDVCAAAFRLICHTDFERRVMAMLKTLILSDDEDVKYMISL